MKIWFPSILVSLLVCGSVLVYGQSEVEARAAEGSQTLVKEHVAWETKLSSPGASIRVKEVQRQGSLVKYNLYVSGLPSDELYTALSWPVTQAKPSPLIDWRQPWKRWDRDVCRKDARAVRRFLEQG
jgi:hypothetical protein